ncbi:beta-glucosidase [Demequina sp. NBRC 110054]|uniref:beta-glucosidase family protein n=1 Tax=Demequina sp. NBRC 110054 TaxID=1570343 RepID=UPI000A06E737|nr:glycoside hydrolase family 3 C-terminal domain-containing protein [Demequina sp. NBRC 110054]
MDNVARRASVRADLSLAEKASLMSGANFWNTKSVDRVDVPAIMLTDGPHGLRKQGGAADHLGLNASIPATCFPPAATLANSWDVPLLERVGDALGAEAAAEDVSVLLGPGLNIKRNPLGGRSFEYFSEDPLLSGMLAGALARGIQSRGVAACLKHFAVNSQETHRMSVDEIVDERALHELYLEGFRIALDQSCAWTVMTSYNKVNGIYANENATLVEDTLRGRFGFDGLVVTDWGGSNDRVAGLVAGNALEMPSTEGVTDAEIVAAVEAGELDESVLDARVDEVLTLIERTASAREGSAPADLDAHHALAVEAARKSIVMLRNAPDVEGVRLLPLDDPAKAGRVAVVGDFAATPRYQGAGSSLVNPTRVDSALDALRATDLDIIGYEPGFSRMDGQSKRRRRRAVALAQRADVTLLFLGLDESAEAEAVDRAHMRLAENQIALVRELTRHGARLVVVLAGGAPVELPFASSVDAIVHGYLGGQGGGTAIADVLTGAVNPSGRLAETYPMTYADVASSATFGRTQATSEHRESIYLGYRHADKLGAEVRYPFGHGLSYTTFAYSELIAGPRSARVTVTNAGHRAGTETVQVYTEAPDAAAGQFRAPRELAGFAKVTLEPGESRTVEVAYREHAFDVFDAEAGDWATVGGAYRVLAGASSRDLRVSADLTVDGGPMPDADTASSLPHYVSGQVHAVPDEEYVALLGRTLPPSGWDATKELTRDDIIAQCQGRGGFAGFLYWLIDTTGDVLMLLRKPLAANNTHFALDLPFRSVARLSGGAADDHMVDGLLLMVNGQFWKGLHRTGTAWRALRRSKRA